MGSYCSFISYEEETVKYIKDEETYTHRPGYTSFGINTLTNDPKQKQERKEQNKVKYKYSRE